MQLYCSENRRERCDAALFPKRLDCSFATTKRETKNSFIDKDIDLIGLNYACMG
jgi:hypothetical protein